MSDSEKSELISQFSSVTGADTERARFYLECAQWKIDLALGNFYDHGDDVDPIGQPAPSESEPEKEPERTQNKPQSRFATLANVQAAQAEDSDSEGEAYYAGGSEHGAGQQILDPRKKKKKDADKLVQDMFKAAKQHGAEEVNEGAPSGSHSDKPVFRGTAYRLGDSEDSSIMVPGFSADSQAKQVDKVLKLWKDGFSVDNGPLRGYNEPENEQFLSSIKKGEIPRELLDAAKGGEVNLSMEDHRHEDFVKPKVTVKAFSGTGMRLGSPAGSIAVSSTAAGGTAAGGVTAVPKKSSPVKVDSPADESKPCTNLQIRMSDGSRLVAKFNHFHTVADVRNYINSSRPEYATAHYVLMTTFPNKELTDEMQTLQEANLLNAVLVQRLK